MDERELIEALKRTPAADARRTPHCPGEAELAAWLDGDGSGELQHRIEAHVADCEFCLEQTAAILRSLEDSATQESTTQTESEIAANYTASSTNTSTNTCQVLCNRRCSFPGHCRRYTDANGNNRCDLGECA